MTSNGVYAALGLAVAGIGTAPYLGRLTVSVPDRDNRRWWIGSPAPMRRVVVTGASAAATGALAGLAAGWSAVLPAFALLALAGAPLVIIDVERHRLPDRLVLLAAAGGAVLLTAAAVSSGRCSDLARCAEAAALVFALGTLLTIAVTFGWGDAKLAAVLAGYLGWFGWRYVLYGILAGFVLAALIALPLVLIGRARLKTPIPLGPTLIVGALAVTAIGLPS